MCPHVLTVPFRPRWTSCRGGESVVVSLTHCWPLCLSVCLFPSHTEYNHVDILATSIFNLLSLQPSELPADDPAGHCVHSSFTYHLLFLLELGSTCSPARFPLRLPRGHPCSLPCYPGLLSAPPASGGHPCRAPASFPLLPFHLHPRSAPLDLFLLLLPSKGNWKAVFGTLHV